MGLCNNNTGSLSPFLLTQDPEMSAAIPLGPDETSQAAAADAPGAETKIIA